MQSSWPTCTKQGLSPRVRGNRRCNHSVSGQQRSAERVYPRECGGTGVPGRADGGESGLSPRVRGNPVRGPFAGQWTGSIPASAGEPRTAWSGRGSATVYPRECGGTLTPWTRTGSTCGLSPRVRGNPRRGRRRQPVRRSIPASAGEPSPRSGKRMMFPVYPRECGGTCNQAQLRQQMAGLSPEGGGGTMTAGAQPTHIQGLSPRVRGNRTPSLWTPHK